VSPNEDGTSSTSALQMTMQCMAMVAEGALEEEPANANACRVADTFTAIVEMKEAKVVDNDWFLLNVPVTFRSPFPKKIHTAPFPPDLYTPNPKLFLSLSSFPFSFSPPATFSHNTNPNPNPTVKQTTAQVLANEEPMLSLAFPHANNREALGGGGQSPEALKRALLGGGGSISKAVRDFNLCVVVQASCHWHWHDHCHCHCQRH